MLIVYYSQVIKGHLVKARAAEQVAVIKQSWGDMGDTYLLLHTVRHKRAINLIIHTSLSDRPGIWPSRRSSTYTE